MASENEPKNAPLVNIRLGLVCVYHHASLFSVSFSLSNRLLRLLLDVLDERWRSVYGGQSCAAIGSQSPAPSRPVS